MRAVKEEDTNAFAVVDGEDDLVKRATCLHNRLSRLHRILQGAETARGPLHLVHQNPPPCLHNVLSRNYLSDVYLLRAILSRPNQFSQPRICCPRSTILLYCVSSSRQATDVSCYSRLALLTLSGCLSCFVLRSHLLCNRYCISASYMRRAK